MTNISKPGEWRRPPCYYCRRRIEATARLEHAPVFLKEVYWWAHWSCLRGAKAQPLPERAGPSRGMCKTGTQVDFRSDLIDNGRV